MAAALRESEASVLLVDDLPPNLMALEAVLEPLDAHLVRASSGQDALRALLEGRFACILLDVQMPGLDGYETARLIREREKTRDIPIIFITATSREEAQIVRGYSEGAIDYIVKPFSPTVVRAKVAALLEIYTRERAAEERAASLALQIDEMQRQLKESQSQALRLAQSERARLYGLLMQAPFAVVVLRGPDHVVELVNPIAVSLLQRRDLAGRSLFAAGPDFTSARQREILDRVFHTREPYIGTEVPVTLDGAGAPLASPRFFNVVAQPTYGLSGEVDGIQVCGFEVTSQVHGRREAEATVALRDEFLSVAAHEFRTPLTALLLRMDGVLKAQRAGTASAQAQQAHVENARKVLKRLSVLVDGLLDVSHVATDAFQLEAQKGVDLTAIVRAVLESYRDPADSLGSTLTLDAPPELRGEWDAARLEQVVTHLLANALKYGASKPVEVRVSEENGRAVVSVRDHGIGVAPEALSRIFGKYERAVSSDNYGGLGLGLYIARKVVEAMSGGIEVESEPGKGTTVRVAVPLVPAPQKRLRPTPG